MTINSISSNTTAIKPIAPTAPEAREVGPDHDGDADDSSGKVSAPIKPATVNPQGQAIGTTITVKA